MVIKYSGSSYSHTIGICANVLLASNDFVAFSAGDCCLLPSDVMFLFWSSKLRCVRSSRTEEHFLHVHLLHPISTKMNAMGLSRKRWWLWKIRNMVRYSRYCTTESESGRNFDTTPPLEFAAALFAIMLLIVAWFDVPHKPKYLMNKQRIWPKEQR